MAEIRNLTRNGETFYPLCSTAGLVNREGAAMGEINDIFDISEYNATGNPITLATYTSLSSALNAVPQNRRKGGMTVRYVYNNAEYTVVRTAGLTTEPVGTEITTDPNISSGTYNESQLSVFASLPTTVNSTFTYYMEVAGDTTTYTSWVITYAHSSDNKYVQCRYMSTSTAADFTNVANWQGVDDEPVAGSENLVKSGGVYKQVSQLGQEVYGVGTKSYPGQLRNNGTIRDTAGVTYRVWNCKGGDVVRFKAPTSMRFYVVSEFQFNPVLPYTLVLATGETGEHITAGSSTIYSITLPQDAAYIVINNVNPTLFEINGRNVLESIENLATQAKDEIDKRIWIIVGQGTWQLIGKTDWQVGDRWFGYNAPEDSYYILEATKVSGGGTTVSTFSPVCIAPQDALYVMDGHFYTYKGGDLLTRIEDISEVYSAIETLSSNIDSTIGTLSNLVTTEKASIVGAINEVVNTIIGSLSRLNTTNKSSVVSAINELVGKFFDSSSEIQSVRSGKYWNTGDLSVGSNFTGNSKNLATQYSADIVSVQEGDVFKYYGLASNAPQIKTYVITDSSDKVLVISTLTSGVDYRTTPFDIVIPENGAKLYVNFSASYDSTTDKLVKFVNDEISIPELNTRISALETDITELQKLPWYGKTIVCFGDSITEFSLSTKKRYSDYLADITGANVINVGVGGSRLQQRTTPVDVPTTQLQAGAALDIVNMVKASCEQVFTQQVAGVNWLYDNTGRDIRDVVTRLQSIDWSVVDAVTIFGGTNDWTGNDGNTGTADSTDINTTLGALNYMIDLLTYTYPKVRVFYFNPPVRGFDDSLASGAKSAFNPVQSYVIGEDVFYNGMLWRFTANHTGAWNDADARRITISELSLMGSDVVEQNGTTLLQFSRTLKEVAEQHSIPVCDIYKTLWNIYQFPSVAHADFTHPLNGMEQIAEKFYGFISANRNFDM